MLCDRIQKTHTNSECKMFSCRNINFLNRIFFVRSVFYILIFSVQELWYCMGLHTFALWNDPILGTTKSIIWKSYIYLIYQGFGFMFSIEAFSRRFFHTGSDFLFIVIQSYTIILLNPATASQGLQVTFLISWAQIMISKTKISFC